MVRCVLLILAMTTVSLAVLDSTEVLPTYPNSRLLSNAAEFIPGLRGYEIVYQSCKAMEVRVDERKHIIPPREQYVIYRLCPSAKIHRDSSCSDDFGEYAVFLKDYLSEMLRYHMSDQDKEFITPYTHCQMIYDPSETANRLYAGPLCSGKNGMEITMGVFTDPYCMIPDPTKNVDDYVRDEHGVGLNEFWDTSFYSENRRIELFSCRFNGFLETCKSLHSKSSRCEIPHGFKPINDDQSLHFVSNDVHYASEEESWECSFIDTLKASKATNYGQQQLSELFVDWIALASLWLAAGVTMVLVHRKFRKQTKQSSISDGAEVGGGRVYYELIPMDRN